MPKVWLTQLLVVLAILGGSCSTANPVDKLARKYRVPRERILAVAKMLSVDPQKIEAFQLDAPFPVNYYGELLEAPSLSQRKRKSEVLTFIQGYAAMCVRESSDFNSSLLYFFYSTQVVRPADEVPLVMEIHFHQPIGANDHDPRVSNIGLIDVTEPDFNPTGSTYYKECIDKRGKLGIIP